MPDGSIMQATHKSELNLSPLLSTRGGKQHTYSYLQPGAQIYIGQLFDHGCTATFTTTTMTLHKQGEKSKREIKMEKQACYRSN